MNRRLASLQIVLEEMGAPSEGEDMGGLWGGTDNPQDFRRLCSEVDFYALREKEEKSISETLV